MRCNRLFTRLRGWASVLPLPIAGASRRHAGFLRESLSGPAARLHRVALSAAALGEAESSHAYVFTGGSPVPWLVQLTSHGSPERRAELTSNVRLSGFSTMRSWLNQ